jgi:N-acetyl-gamma-glutamylphosphate reductase
MKLGVAILGGTGFGAGELMRLLSNHPEAKMVAATSEGFFRSSSFVCGL